MKTRKSLLLTEKDLADIARLREETPKRKPYPKWPAEARRIGRRRRPAWASED